MHTWSVGDHLTHRFNSELGTGRVTAIEGRVIVVEFASVTLRFAAGSEALIPAADATARTERSPIERLAAGEYDEADHFLTRLEILHLLATREADGPVWMGRVDDTTKVEMLSSSAIYVAPQTGGESFGIVLVEAMAAGAAVVASDLEPFRAVAGDAARFFPPGDSDALAREIVDLLSHPDARADLSAAGLQVAAGYDWNVVGPRYREVYEEAVS